VTAAVVIVWQAALDGTNETASPADHLNCKIIPLYRSAAISAMLDDASCPLGWGQIRSEKSGGSV